MDQLPLDQRPHAAQKYRKCLIRHAFYSLLVIARLPVLRYHRNLSFRCGCLALKNRCCRQFL